MQENKLKANLNQIGSGTIKWYKFQMLICSISDTIVLALTISFIAIGSPTPLPLTPLPLPLFRYLAVPLGRGVTLAKGAAGSGITLARGAVHLDRGVTLVKGVCFHGKSTVGP